MLTADSPIFQRPNPSAVAKLVLMYLHLCYYKAPTPAHVLFSSSHTCTCAIIKFPQELILLQCATICPASHTFSFFTQPLRNYSVSSLQYHLITTIIATIRGSRSNLRGFLFIHIKNYLYYHSHHRFPIVIRHN